MSSRSAFSLCALALLLSACQRNEPPPPTVIVAPAGEPGPAGPAGETGKPGANAVVIVTPPASAASAT